jgi:hypothetical protein
MVLVGTRQVFFPFALAALINRHIREAFEKCAMNSLEPPPAIPTVSHLPGFRSVISLIASRHKTPLRGSLRPGQNGSSPPICSTTSRCMARASTT